MLKKSILRFMIFLIIFSMMSCSTMESMIPIELLNTVNSISTEVKSKEPESNKELPVQEKQVITGQENSIKTIPNIHTYLKEAEIIEYLLDVVEEDVKNGKLLESYTILASLKSKEVPKEIHSLVQDAYDVFMDQYGDNDQLVRNIKDSDLYRFKHWTGEYGFLNDKGDIVINPEYEIVGPFSNGLALITGPKRFYIDYEGNPVIQENDHEGIKMFFSNTFNEELALVSIKYEDNSSGDGYINTKGEIVIEPRAGVEYLSDFQEGLAIASKRVDGENLKGFVDKQGEWVIRPQFEDAHLFSEGMAAVQYQFDGSWGYVDKAGNTYKPVFGSRNFVGDFHNGLALGFHVSSDSYTFVDKQFEIVKALDYDDIKISKQTEFSEGFAFIRFGSYHAGGSDSLIVIDTSGYIVHEVHINEQIQQLQHRDLGIAQHTSYEFGSASLYFAYDGTGFFDYFGDVTLEPAVRGISEKWFAMKSSASNGLYYVQYTTGDSDYGYIDQYGNVIYRP